MIFQIARCTILWENEYQAKVLLKWLEKTLSFKKIKETFSGNFNVIEGTRVLSENVWVKEPARVQLFNHGARSDAY